MTTERYSLGKVNPFANWIPAMVFVMAMFSSFVFVEPAPVDILTLGAAVVLFATGLRLPRDFLPPMLLLLMFILGNFIAIPFAPLLTPAAIYTGVTAYLVLGLMLYVGLMYWDYQRLMIYFWNGYVVAAVIATVAAMIGFFGWTPYYELFILNDRAAGTFKDPNVFGPFLGAVILYLVNSLEDRKGMIKVVNVLLLLLLLFGLFITFSRGAIASFLLSLSIMLVIKLRIRNSLQAFRHYFVYGIGIAVLVVLTLGVLVMVSDRLQTMVELRGKVVQSYDVEEGGRFNTQKLALERALQTPLGNGPGDSDVVLGLEPHNVYLLVLVETGVIGFIGWVGFFGLTVYRSTGFLRRSLLVPKDFLPVYAALMGTLILSFFIDSIHWRHMFVLSGVIWGMMLAVRHQQAEWLLQVSTGPSVETPEHRKGADEVVQT